MTIFNSLGSNYNLSFVLKSLFLQNKKNYKTDLEKYLSEKFNGKVLLTYKGRQAIEIALKLLDLPKTSVVAINGFTCFAVYQAVVNAGLTVDYIDIEKGDLNFSPKQLEEAIKNNPKIKVVIIQNTLGYPAETEKIAEICKANNIILIEDLAHSVGAKYRGNLEAGMLGDFVVLSFSQDKIIDAISGGAMVERTGVKLIHPPGGIRWHLISKYIDRLYPFFTYIIRNTYSFGLGKIIHTFLKSLNLLSQPMDNGKTFATIAPWYCQLAHEQLNNLEENLSRRRKIATIYSKNIDQIILSNELTKNILNSTNLRFPIFVKDRTSLIKFLKKQGIFVSDIWYDAPIAPKKYMTQTNYTNQCPNAEKASATILNLPTHKNISEQDALQISQIITQWIHK